MVESEYYCLSAKGQEMLELVYEGITDSLTDAEIAVLQSARKGAYFETLAMAARKFRTPHGWRYTSPQKAVQTALDLIDRGLVLPCLAPSEVDQ